MNDPIRLHDALLDEELLAKLPGLLPHLTNPRPPALPPHATQFLDELRTRTAHAPNTTTEHTNHGGNLMDRNGIDGHPVISPDPNDQHTRERELMQRARQVEVDAEQVREQVRLDETRRTQEALRLSGYDAPVTERTRPATPRPPR